MSSSRTSSKEKPPAADGETRESEEIKADIETTREDLGDTVEALAEKTDVKAQAKKKATETKEQTQAKVDRATSSAKSAVSELPEKVKTNPVPFAAAAVGVLAAVWVLRRRG